VIIYLIAFAIFLNCTYVHCLFSPPLAPPSISQPLTLGLSKYNLPSTLDFLDGGIVYYDLAKFRPVSSFMKLGG
jgi:hypothetical protein